jgi:hypothetical protein
MSFVIPLAKLVVGSAVSVSVWKVVGDIVKNNVTVVTRADTAKVLAGSTALSAVVTKHTHDYILGGVDSMAAWYENRHKTDDTPESSE